MGAYMYNAYTWEQIKRLYIQYDTGGIAYFHHTFDRLNKFLFESSSFKNGTKINKLL